MTAIAWGLLALAFLLGVTGKPEAGLFLAFSAIVVYVLGPTEEQADARRRNPVRQARRVR